MEKADKNSRITLYVIISVIVILFDQATKHLIRNLIDSFRVIKVLPFLQIVNIRNKGAAFGMFTGFGNIVFIIIAALSIVFVVYLLVKGKEDRFGLSLVLGGAAGNLIDRILFGSVTDFIDVFVGRFHWPAFNVADSALTIGILIIFLKIVRSG